MKSYTKDGNYILEGIDCFDIEEILECGQCFHFKKLADRDYELINFGRYLHISQKNDTVTMYNVSEQEYEGVWRSYFDIDTDYNYIKSKLKSVDKRLVEAIDAKGGVRILNQDFFETLISFIISQNKQIPHIKQIVHLLSERYGDEIIVDGNKHYMFPTVKQLLAVSEEELRACKVGFRAPYIRDAVVKVADGEISEQELRSLSRRECMDKLMTIKGVGAKVANCVMLFSLGHRATFPVDVWMKRIMEYMYFEGDTRKEEIERLAYEMYGEYSGYAQQYLFYYGREIGIGK